MRPRNIRVDPFARLGAILHRIYRHGWRTIPGRIFALRAARALTTRREAEWRRLRSSSGLLLEVGASSALPGWICLDIVDPGENGLLMDAAKPWPLPDGCAQAIRCEHMVEHLTFTEATFCIQEMYRVLEPGGLCRICTPDLEGISTVYLRRDPALLEVHRRHGYAAPTWSHLPNNYLRMWGHLHVFDFDALKALMTEAGFADVERAPFNHSRHPLLDGTDGHDPEELAETVLCVDAVKPNVADLATNPSVPT